MTVALIVPFLSDIPFLLGAGIGSFVTWKVAHMLRRSEA